jgi:TonB family protein
MASDALSELVQATLALTVALALVATLRRPLRRWLGAQAVYASWAMLPLAALAVLLPAPSGGVMALPAVTGLTQALPGISPGPTALPLAAIALGLWLVGAAALFVLMLVRQRRFQRSVLRQPEQAHDESAWATPAVTGLLRPRIVLPADFAARYTPEEQRLVIAHEQLHIERGDIPAQALATLIRCVFWFHPLVHLAAARFRFDQELACDAAVVARFPESRRRYGDAMLKTQLAEFGLPVGCHWQSSHPLKERVAMLKHAVPSPTYRRFGLTVVAAIVSGASLAAWASQAPSGDTAAVSMPTFQSMSKPQFPALAKDAGISGHVDVEIQVGADGRVTDVVVVRSQPSGVFDEAAVAAVRQWTFNPGIDAATGEPAASRVRVPIQFEADGEPEISVEMQD